jgi:colicin import membrane protein
MTRSLSTALDSLEDWWQSSQAITQEPRNGLLAHSQAFSYSNRGWLSPPAPPRLHPAVLEAERGAAAVARDADGGSVLAKLRAENLALRERLRGAQAPGGAAEPNGVSKPSPPLKDPTIALSVVFEEASRRAAEPRSDYRSTQHAAELAATTAAAARARARELAANKAASEAQLQEALRRAKATAEADKAAALKARTNPAAVAAQSDAMSAAIAQAVAAERDAMEGKHAEELARAVRQARHTALDESRAAMAAEMNSISEASRDHTNMAVDEAVRSAVASDGHAVASGGLW